MIEVQNHPGDRTLFPSRRAARLEEELKRVSWSDLKPHSDVFEGTGEVRTGLFVANNPVNWIDPLELAMDSVSKNPEAAVSAARLAEGLPDLPVLNALKREAVKKALEIAKNGMKKAAEQIKNATTEQSKQAGKNAFETQSNRAGAIHEAIKSIAAP